MLSPINSFSLQNFIGKYNLKRGVEAYNICEIAGEVLRKVFPVCQDCFNVLSYDGKCIFVKVSNSVLLQELKFREGQIISLIENKAEGVKVGRIIGRV